MEPTAVDALYEHVCSLGTFLEQSGQWSFLVAAEDTGRKSLLLAAASYFEHRLTNDVRSFVQSRVGKDSLVPSLVQTKAISRQYHTWFAWDKSNANQFFGLFGEDFSVYMKKIVSEDVGMAESITAFLSIGSDRNRLAHQDYATFSLESTAHEIFSSYAKGRYFVESLHDHLVACSEQVTEHA